jgi:predicted HAD superfamily hydrolase
MVLFSRKKVSLNMSHFYLSKWELEMYYFFKESHCQPPSKTSIAKAFSRDEMQDSSCDNIFDEINSRQRVSVEISKSSRVELKCTQNQRRFFFLVTPSRVLIQQRTEAEGLKYLQIYRS